MKVFFSGRLLADRVELADTPVKRFWGLMGRKSLRRGEGLLLVRCPSIHCFFMKITIDAVYLSKEMRVIGIETIKPWRLGRLYRGVAHVLELPEGAAGALRAGDLLAVQNSDENGGKL